MNSPDISDSLPVGPRTTGISHPCAETQLRKLAIDMRRKRRINKTFLAHRDGFVGRPCPSCSRVMTKAHRTNSHSATLEHNKPLTVGGLNDQGNISVICKRCNFARNTFLQKCQNELGLPDDYFWPLSINWRSNRKLLEKYYQEHFCAFLDVFKKGGLLEELPL